MKLIIHSMMSAYLEAYAQLNHAQREAVDLIDGPVMVVAGPGSGKTQLLSLRVAHILDSAQVNPENILCLTFTEAAAKNMRQRLMSFIGNQAYKVNIHTFHSFGQSILRNYPEYTEYTENTSIENVEQTEILSQIFQELPYNYILRPRNGDMTTVIAQILKAIAYLKQAGISPDEYEAILNQNKQEYLTCNLAMQQLSAISLRSKAGIDSALEAVRTIISSLSAEGKPSQSNYFLSYSAALVNSLESVVLQSEQLDSLKPLSAWKTKYLVNDHQKNKVLKDSLKADKQAGVAEVYRLYTNYCRQHNYIDFHDMLLKAIEVLAQEPSLQASLQEQYQYILVDEFQDTNDAQMRLILSIVGGNPEPNILVVGDDDQAIYGFQGADVSHMLSFQKLFPSAQLVVLTQNYRSTQSILDIARQVIIQGVDRLENRIEKLEKRLESAKLRQDGDLAYYQFETQEEEFNWIAYKLEQLRAAQEDISDIAIIARKHKQLQALVPYLSQYDIPIEYEKQYDLLQEPIIQQIITLLEYIESLSGSNRAKDHLLGEILTYPFWGIERIEVWKFFQDRPTISYLERLVQSSNSQFQYIGQLCLDLALASTYEPMETIVLAVIGLGEANYRLNSKFYDYYFDQHALQELLVNAVENSKKIQAFLQKISDYKSHQKLSLKEGLGYISALASQGGMQVNLGIKTGQQAVRLITAHRVKGLEFNTVFVIEAHTQAWQANHSSFWYPFPLNLPIIPPQDSEDDFLRLLFVALTRSKQNMFITNHSIDLKGKATQAISYLDFFTPQISSEHPQSLGLRESFLDRMGGKYRQSESAFLEAVISQYKLSPSHLNLFLDVEHGGPSKFLQNVLLGFPQTKTRALAFGNVLHKLFHRISLTIQAGENFPAWDICMDVVKNYVYQERLNPADTEIIIQQCQDSLGPLLEAKRAEFSVPHLSEYKIGKLGLEYAGVPLTGVIDRLEQSEDYYTIVDFKTSLPISAWKQKNKQEILDKYKRQLFFYALLLKVTGNFEDKPLLGRIDFLEPTDKGEYISLSLPIEPEDIEYIQQLVQTVYHKILSLDFPEVESYAKTGGTAEFIADLLSQKI